MGYVDTDSETLRSLIQRVSAGLSPVRWAWAATRESSGESAGIWKPFALVVTTGDEVRAREYTYETIRTVVEAVTPAEAAHRLEQILPTLSEGYGDRGADGLDHVVSRGYWLTTERDVPSHFYAKPDWPEYYIMLDGLSRNNTEVNASDGPMAAPDQPYFPDAVALLEQELTQVRRADQRFQAVTVIRLMDRRARFGDATYVEGVLSFPFEATTPCTARITWRADSSTTWSEVAQVAAPGAPALTLELEALPAELWAVLQGADGKVIDRRGWTLRTGVRPGDPDTNLVRAACLMGEGPTIEFKEVLSPKGNANLEFAESVASFCQLWRWHDLSWHQG